MAHSCAYLIVPSFSVNWLAYYPPIFIMCTRCALCTRTLHSFIFCFTFNWRVPWNGIAKYISTTTDSSKSYLEWSLDVDGWSECAVIHTYAVHATFYWSCSSGRKSILCMCASVSQMRCNQSKPVDSTKWPFKWVWTWNEEKKNSK